jgi:hypothetical protein
MPSHPPIFRPPFPTPDGFVHLYGQVVHVLAQALQTHLHEAPHFVHVVVQRLEERRLRNVAVHVEFEGFFETRFSLVGAKC